VLDPDHDGKQAKYEASQNNVVELKPKKKDGVIKISKVYARGEVKDNGVCLWAYHVTVGDHPPTGYAFDNRTDAVKGRVLFVKKIKAEGYQVHCQS